ncbi:patatin family protein [Enterococcus casseliflavus]|uniref:Patatin family protein n=1 Tax=Enterococcus casseliflavus TaxID=37734 RepID=A0ABD6Z0I4_ENTCA|nr:patatin family protein [Enterococcus casseliflavus]QGN29538.1 patatin family protein [Enterococcus casseliflavus]
MSKKIDFQRLPTGTASDLIVKGCLVIEGGAFRGIYAQGVVDFLMTKGINMECTIGCSAGALTVMNYVSGQIGRSILINLKYRHDKRYIGWKNMAKGKGLIGFDFILNEVTNDYPFDEKRFFLKERRFVTVATDILSGKPRYSDKDNFSDYVLAIQASASMPFISKPVSIEDSLYLEGGVIDSIPYQWGLNQGYKKMIVIRTREVSYRKDMSKKNRFLEHSILTKKYPLLKQALQDRARMYNAQCDKLDMLVGEEKVFCFSPSKPLDVGRLEGNLSKLEGLYYMGYQDAEKMFPNLIKYIEN